MFWLAGFLVRHGGSGVLYAPLRYAAAAAEVLPYKAGYWPFVYPPVILPLAVALSFVPLVAGYYGFCVAVTGLGFWLLRQAGISRWCIVVGLIGPAAMWNLYLGQLGFLCGALLVAGLAGMNTRPVRAGGLLGLLCIKPQYALLVPVVVCAGRYWRVMLAGGAAVLVLLALSWWCGGAAAWIGYLGPGRAATSALLERHFGGFQVMGSSVFWMLRSFRTSVGAAYAGQGVVSAFAVLGCWVMWRSPSNEPMWRLAMTVFLTLLASPYGFTDDLAVYSVMLAVLARRDTPWRNAGLAVLSGGPGFRPKICRRIRVSADAVAVDGGCGTCLAKRLWLSVRYALRSKNSPCSPNQIGQSPASGATACCAPASSAASHCSTL